MTEEDIEREVNSEITKNAEELIKDTIRKLTVWNLTSCQESDIQKMYESSSRR